MPATITEIKHNVNKPDQTFECNLVRHDGDRILISYMSSRPYQIRDTVVASGTLTLGYYQEGLPYIVWKMIGPDNRLTGYYIHLCDRIRIKDDVVEYRDLLLDVWFSPDGSHRLLDDDELEEAVTTGFLDEDTATAVRQTASSVIETFPAIRASLDFHLTTHGESPIF